MFPVFLVHRFHSTSDIRPNQEHYWSSRWFLLEICNPEVTRPLEKLLIFHQVDQVILAVDHLYNRLLKFSNVGGSTTLSTTDRVQQPFIVKRLQKRITCKSITLQHCRELPLSQRFIYSSALFLITHLKINTIFINNFDALKVIHCSTSVHSCCTTHADYKCC